ncbi:hypothetical protein B0T24DRAFT_107193 [Lasiosphaeria ovina]|uniref:Uncharacterized protein n=1 Tax=Lasiosphaeria ovina TaxID=92902 RepID=A0AAE0MZK5_9PEZI|nr:hypothetical protein B0T24DRAFT_107193 [Lasiosphaeria ovina]
MEEAEVKIRSCNRVKVSRRVVRGPAAAIVCDAMVGLPTLALEKQANYMHFFRLVLRGMCGYCQARPLETVHSNYTYTDTWDRSVSLPQETLTKVRPSPLPDGIWDKPNISQRMAQKSICAYDWPFAQMQAINCLDHKPRALHVALTGGPGPEHQMCQLIHPPISFLKIPRMLVPTI